MVSADAAWNSPAIEPGLHRNDGDVLLEPPCRWCDDALGGGGDNGSDGAASASINSARDWNGPTPVFVDASSSSDRLATRGRLGRARSADGPRAALLLPARLCRGGRGGVLQGHGPRGLEGDNGVPDGVLHRVPRASRQNPVGVFKYTQSNLDLHQYDATDTEVTAPPAFDPPDTAIDPGPDAGRPQRWSSSRCAHPQLLGPRW